MTTVEKNNLWGASLRVESAKSDELELIFHATHAILLSPLLDRLCQGGSYRSKAHVESHLMDETRRYHRGTILERHVTCNHSRSLPNLDRQLGSCLAAFRASPESLKLAAVYLQ